MRKPFGLAFPVCVTVALVVGCSNDSQTVTPGEFKPTDTSPLDEMKNQMIKSQSKKGKLPIAKAK